MIYRIVYKSLWAYCDRVIWSFCCDMIAAAPILWDDCKLKKEKKKRVNACTILYRLTGGCNIGIGQHLVLQRRWVLSDVPYRKSSKSAFLLEFTKTQGVPTFDPFPFHESQGSIMVSAAIFSYITSGLPADQLPCWSNTNSSPQCVAPTTCCNWSSPELGSLFW